MQRIRGYMSPLGPITLAEESGRLAGLWFDGQKYDRATLDATCKGDPSPLLDEVCHWLDRYFAGENPGALPPLAPRGSAFRQAVWSELTAIPFGSLTTYGALARVLEEKTGIHCSARAIGGAVGHNPISIIVPCHRVVGSNGRLTGYAGGLERKIALLCLEGVEVDERMGRVVR